MSRNAIQNVLCSLNRINLIAIVLGSLLANSCAHEIQSNPEYGIDQGKDSMAKRTVARQTIFKTHYLSGSSGETVEWTYCQNQSDSGSALSANDREYNALTKAKPIWLMFHDENNGFVMEGFCDSALPQVFLGLGYETLAVNRPGYGSSSGKRQFFSKESHVAIKSVLNRFKSFKDSADANIEGVWGYSMGASEALWTAKLPEFNQVKVIAGGGMYDLPQLLATTANADLKSRLKALQTEDASALDNASIAFDFEDLPNESIYLYHAKQDEIVPLEQSEGFADALRTSQKKAQLRLVDKASHQLSADRHRATLQAIFQEMLKK